MPLGNTNASTHTHTWEAPGRLGETLQVGLGVARDRPKVRSEGRPEFRYEKWAPEARMSTAIGAADMLGKHSIGASSRKSAPMAPCPNSKPECPFRIEVPSEPGS